MHLEWKIWCHSGIILTLKKILFINFRIKSVKAYNQDLSDSNSSRQITHEVWLNSTFESLYSLDGFSYKIMVSIILTSVISLILLLCACLLISLLCSSIRSLSFCSRTFRQVVHITTKNVHTTIEIHKETMRIISPMSTLDKLKPKIYPESEFFTISAFTLYFMFNKFI